jgi:CIC family chloride channel protein
MKAMQGPREWAAEYLRAAAMGLVGGAACLLFREGVERVQVLVGFGTEVVEGARRMPWWQLLLIPAAGMVLAGLIAQFLVPRGRGAGFADIMEAVSIKRGGLSMRSAVSRSLGSLCAIATGGSVGREGPIISLASAGASRLAGIFRAAPKDRGLLVGCGVAAGFGAAYDAPFAGAVFALEVVLGNFAMELFGPVVIASATATLFMRYVAHQETVYSVGTFELVSAAEVFPYVLLGVLCGFVAVGFQDALRRVESALGRLRMPRIALMGFGGLVVGALAIPFPEVCGNGYRAVSEILNHSNPRFTGAPWWELAVMMLALGVVKTLGTAVTVGAGASGGVFTPSLFVGAAIGGAFGAVLAHLFPGATGDYGGYALVGMGCLVAGTTRAPIMAVLVIFEMTLVPEIMVPLLLGTITASLVARSLYPYSIYDEGFVARGAAPPSGIEETVLRTTRVEDVMRTKTTWASPSTTYAEIIPLVTASRANVVYVCGDGMKYLGVIRLLDVIELARLGDLGPGIIALDLMTAVEPVTPQTSLAAVFDAMEAGDVDELPVVDGPESGKLLAHVTRRDVMAALHMEVLGKHNLRAKFVRRDDDATHTDYVELPRGVELARVPVRPEHCERTLGEVGVRSGWRLTVLSIVRTDGEGRELRILPDASMTLRRGDEMIVLGAQEDIRKWQGEVEAR